MATWMTTSTTSTRNLVRLPEHFPSHLLTAYQQQGGYPPQQSYPMNAYPPAPQPGVYPSQPPAGYPPQAMYPQQGYPPQQQHY